MSKDKTSVRGAMALANSFAAAWARDEMIENPRTFRAPEAEEKLRDYLERLVAETRIDAAGVAREVEQLEAAQAQPSGWQLIEAGWQAALDCHAHYGMAGWSSHRKEYLSKAASPSPNDPPSDHPPITWSGDVKVEPGEL